VVRRRNFGAEGSTACIQLHHYNLALPEIYPFIFRLMFIKGHPTSGGSSVF